MTPEKSSKSDKVPYVDEGDPLPAFSKPEGRWAAPYLSHRTGLWTVHLRVPLTHRQMAAGLTDKIYASTWGALKAGMERQDRRAAELGNAPDAAPTWTERARP